MAPKTVICGPQHSYITGNGSRQFSSGTHSQWRPHRQFIRYHNFDQARAKFQNHGWSWISIKSEPIMSWHMSRVGMLQVRRNEWLWWTLDIGNICGPTLASKIHNSFNLKNRTTILIIPIFLHGKILHNLWFSRGDTKSLKWLVIDTCTLEYWRLGDVDRCWF